jgi:shikimate dehydrogenase
MRRNVGALINGPASTLMKRIDLIGSPVTHVLSPSIINPMLRAAGDDVQVVGTEVAEGKLAEYVRMTRAGNEVVGLIVTTPLKQPILSHLDEATDLVRLVGASNCVRFDNRTWLGANFDGFGFIDGMAAVVGRPSNQRILLVGCGGAGGAIAASLVMTGKVDLALYDIEATKPARLATRLAAVSASGARIRPAEPIGEFDVVINASPVGMHPSDPLPLPRATVARATIIADIVAPDDTPLKRLARALGKPLVTGESMVFGQAALLHRFLLSRAVSEYEVIAARDGRRNALLLD